MKMIVAASLKSPNCTYPSSTLKALPLECCRRSRIILIVKQSFYQLSTNCLPTVYYSLPTIYHLSTFCLPTIYQLSTNYLPTIYSTGISTYINTLYIHQDVCLAEGCPLSEPSSPNSLSAVRATHLPCVK